MNQDDNKVSTGTPINEGNEVVKKERNLFSRIFFHSLIKYIVSIFISIVIILIVLTIKGFKYLVSYCDGLFIAGGVLIGIGLLSLLASYGNFDIFSYSGKYVYNRIRNKSVERYSDYSKNKMLNRKDYTFGYIPYITIGVIEVLISAVMLIIN